MAVLIETRPKSLKLSESKVTRKGCLGRLEGICADFINPTRNGRLYNRKLWENVFNNDLIKESLESKTLIGELDHPEERFEPLAKEACVVMTDYSFDDDAGVVYGGFDILDTPSGRILKSLLDYGCIVGVSSRGQGDCVTDSNGERVDEDTYEFACFDVVTTPAVASARQQVKEGLGKQKISGLVESIKTQISNATNFGELDTIERVVESANLPNMDEIKQSIEDKRNSYILSDGKTISGDDKTALQQAIDKIAELEERLNTYETSTTGRNQSVKTINDNGDTTAKTVGHQNEAIKRMYNSISLLSKKLIAYKRRESTLMTTVESLKAKYEDNQSTLSKVSRQLQVADEEYEKADSRLRSVTEQLHTVRAKQTQLQQHNNRLRTQLTEAQSNVRTTSSKNVLLTNKVNTLSETINNLNDNNTNLLTECEALRNTKKSLSEQLQVFKQQQTLTDNDVDNYSGLLQTAETKLAEEQQRYTEANIKLSEAYNTIKSVKQHLKSYQTQYVTTKAKQQGIDPAVITNSLNESVTTEQVDKLISEAVSQRDRYTKLPFASHASSVTVLTENIDNSNKTVEDTRLEKLVMSVGAIQ